MAAILSDAISWAVVILLGVLVGAAELCARYRDNPWRAVSSGPSVLYIAINAAASAIAYELCQEWEPLKKLATGWTQVMLAGIGGMALFRSSVFSVRAGDRDIAIGPGAFLQVFLTVADREVDRLRAEHRAKTVEDLCRKNGLDPDKVLQSLVPYSLALMQNVPADTQRELRDVTERLKSEEQLTALVRMRMLMLALSEVVGLPVLEQAIHSLGDAIKPDAAGPAPAAGGQSGATS